MAVDELRDYLENGSIVHSVNYPECSAGVCEHAGRVAIFHRNIANMITQFTSVCGDAGINIAEMTNKSKGDVAYTLMDLDTPVTPEVITRLSSVDNVFRVRVIK